MGRGEQGRINKQCTISILIQSEEDINKTFPWDPGFNLSSSFGLFLPSLQIGSSTLFFSLNGNTGKGEKKVGTKEILEWMALFNLFTQQEATLTGTLLSDGDTGKDGQEPSEKAKQ